MKKGIMFWIFLGAWILLLVPAGWAQEDPAVQAAREIAKVQLRIPKEVDLKFIEKRQSNIPGYLIVKFHAMAPDREIPIVMYVDPAGEKVFVGSLFIKGTNVTRQEAGEPIVRQMDMGQFGIEKSALRGGEKAKVTIVEFSNFECPYCRQSWAKIKELLEKHPQDLRYVFKHFPLQHQGRPFDLSALVAATQEVSSEAFWQVHDFLFTDEGQKIVRLETGKVKEKIEELLKEKGFDVQPFQTAWENGAGKRKVEEDLTIGRKIQVSGTPTTIVNGYLQRGGVSDETIHKYMKE